MNHIFKDRRDAARALSAAMAEQGHRLRDAVVLALPRGGVPVGREVARALGAPLDVLVVRKLGVPGQPELAMGAVASGGVRVAEETVLREARISPDVFEHIAEKATRELERRERLFRGARPPLDVRDRTVILVDDGIATGSTMLAAIQGVRARGAGMVVVAVPVAPAEMCARLRREADSVICLETPEPFGAVGFWYESFAQVTDDEVGGILEQARKEHVDGRNAEQWDTNHHTGCRP